MAENLKFYTLLRIGLQMTRYLGCFVNCCPNTKTFRPQSTAIPQGVISGKKIALVGGKGVMKSYDRRVAFGVSDKLIKNN
ncbi:MAG: hypothetical protein ACI88A_000434 [Paraglaciecola sp.]